MKAHIVVAAADDDAESRARAAAMAIRLETRVASQRDLHSAEYCLYVTRDSLELGRAGINQPRTRISWSLRKAGGGKRDPLLRAIGAPGRRVLDATAGFGNDSFVMAQNRYTVVAVEREPALAMLFEDALASALQDPALSDTAGRIEFQIGDARDVMTRPGQSFDTIYLDPMYPPKRKRSALPRLPMQLLHGLVGEDSDLPALFEASRRNALDRVVIKRPTHAPHLAGEPTVVYEGKLVRYDVYYRAP